MVDIVSVLMVFVGSLFLLFSFRPARNTRTVVPQQLRGKWQAIIYLMTFFFAGYLFFDVALLSGIPFPVELVTGSVFLGGAVFVFLVITLSRDTVNRIHEVEQELRGLNESLEQRVMERTRELEHAYQFNKAVLDSMSDPISIVDTQNRRIVGANRAFLEAFGLTEETAQGRLCCEVIYGLSQPCDETTDCPLRRTVAGGCEAMVEHRYRDGNGNARLAEAVTSPLFDDDGAVVQVVYLLRDITERKQTEEKLRRSQQATQAILNSMPYGVVLIGKDKTIRSVNNAALALMQYECESQIVSMQCNRTLCPAEEGRCPIIDLKENLDHSERVLVRKDGSRIPILKTVIPVEIEGEEVLMEAIIDISEQKRAEERIRLLAYYDGLTGLPNRTFYKELMGRALSHAKRKGLILATLFVDLDGFKRINDTLGHDSGDLLLKTVAERLQAVVRKSDCVSRPDDERMADAVYRLGGDEFVVLLNGIEQENDAARVAGRIIADISRPVRLRGQEVFITASVGISLFPGDGTCVETLLRNADIAMYHAKAQGKNTCLFYSESMNAAAMERLTMENELRRALERNEFELHYQPKIDLRRGSITGMEALVRWRHPKKGLVPPSEFIPVAEETGMIVPLGEWVLRTACRQNRAWQDAGMAAMPVAVNISRHQFKQENLAALVIGTLEESGLPAGCLELEITESTIMQNPEQAIATLRELQDKGVSVSIDDFGTGYSSLDYLRRLPLNALKVDRSFVARLTSAADDVAIVQAIIAMAHSLQLQVVAEGVETEEQREALRDLQCDEVQGYLFSRPVPAEEFARVALEYGGQAR